MKIKEIPVHTSNDFIINSKVNVTFHELFKMNDKQFAKWKKDLQNLLRKWVAYLRQYPLANRVKWSVDVDPIEF